MPVLDSTKTKGIIGQVISDILLQLLGYILEQERAFIKQRQAEGVKITKQKVCIGFRQIIQGMCKVITRDYDLKMNLLKILC